MNDQQTTAQRGMTAVPAARVDDLVITEAADELLVYDKQRHQIHHLNRTSAVIWRLCDGKRSASGLAAAAGTDLGGDVNVDVVELAVAKLADANLLTQTATGSAQGVAYSRRKVLRRAAVAGAIAVPAIISMTAPAAADIGSCVGVNECTKNDAQDHAACCTQCTGFVSAGGCIQTTVPKAGVVYVCDAVCVG